MSKSGKTLAVVFLAAVLAAAVAIVAASYLERRAAASKPQPPTSQAAKTESVTVSTDSSAGLDVPDTADTDQVIGDSLARFDEQRKARVEKARKELEEKLYGGILTREYARSPAGRLFARPSLEERARLIEEFLREFPLSSDTYACAFTLGDTYSAMGRFDDARRAYTDVAAMLGREQAFGMQQEALESLAKLEVQAGDLQAAEKVLRDIMAMPAPGDHESIDEQVNARKNLEAPLLLADVYRSAGRAEDAEAVLKDVEEYALSLPQDSSLHGNMAWYTGRACGARITLLFDAAGVERLDEATKAANILIDEYARKLQGQSWRTPEHTENYIKGYVVWLHARAAETACHMRIDSLFEKAAPAGAEEALRTAETIADEFVRNVEPYAVNASEQSKGDIAVQAECMRTYARDLAAKKNAGTPP